MFWVGRDLKVHPVPPPATGRDTFHYSRLLQATSSLALDTSRDGEDFNQGKDFPSPSHRTLAGMDDGGVWALSIPDVPAGVAACSRAESEVDSSALIIQGDF